MFSDGCAQGQQPQGQLSCWHGRSFPGFGSCKATAIESWGGFFLSSFGFCFNGNFITMAKEIINSGCREAGGRLRAWISGDQEGEDAEPLSAHAFPAPLAAEPARGFAA